MELRTAIVCISFLKNFTQSEQPAQDRKCNGKMLCSLYAPVYLLARHFSTSYHAGEAGGCPTPRDPTAEPESRFRRHASHVSRETPTRFGLVPPTRYEPHAVYGGFITTTSTPSGRAASVHGIGEAGAERGGWSGEPLHILRHGPER